MSKYLTRALAATRAGQGKKEQSNKASLTESQSKRAKGGMVGGSIITGDWRVTTMGKSSEHMEERGVSQEETKRERGVFAKARSSTDGLEIVSKGKWV